MIRCFLLSLVLLISTIALTNCNVSIDNFIYNVEYTYIAPISPVVPIAIAPSNFEFGTYRYTIEIIEAYSGDTLKITADSISHTLTLQTNAPSRSFTIRGETEYDFAITG